MKNNLNLCFMAVELDDQFEVDSNSVSFDDDFSSFFGSNNDNDDENNDDNDGDPIPSNKKNTDADVDADKIFDTKNPQGNVGNDNKDNDGEDVNPDDDDSSPNSTSSAYLKALKQDGVLPDIDDDFIESADSSEKFAEAIEKQVSARFDERTRRIEEALNSGVAVDEIKSFENAISYLDGIDESTLEDESDESTAIRQKLIYQDFLNKGYSAEKSKKMMERSFNAGTDVDDAKEALQSNLEYFREEYNDRIAQKKAKVDSENRKKREAAESLRKKIIESKNPYGIKVDETTKKKFSDNVLKPSYKIDGVSVNEIQKYQKENPIDFEFNVGLLYTITDGFKNIDKLIGDKVKEGKKSALRELDRKLKNTPITESGDIDFSSGLDDDSKDIKIIF